MTTQAVDPFASASVGFVVTMSDMWAHDAQTSIEVAESFVCWAPIRLDPVSVAQELNSGSIVQCGDVTVGPASHWVAGEWI